MQSDVGLLIRTAGDSLDHFGHLELGEHDTSAETASERKVLPEPPLVLACALEFELR